METIIVIFTFTVLALCELTGIACLIDRDASGPYKKSTEEVSPALPDAIKDCPWDVVPFSLALDELHSERVVSCSYPADTMYLAGEPMEDLVHERFD